MRTVRIWKDALDDLAQRPARAPRLRSLRLQHALAVFGPGIVVMLADTDVGSIITAANSGVQFGYRMLVQQLLLVPVLYIVQELTVRLGIFTGRGHGELIRERFGRGWAWLSAAGLGIATAGALLTEFAGVAGVGELYGVPRGVSVSLAAVALLGVVLTGSYRRVERAAIAVGLFEFVFFFVAWAAHPDMGLMARQALDVPWHNQQFWFLTAANVGAVIMPWMVFYQQSAVADKRLRPEHFSAARWDTAVGALITQLVMAAVVIATAATIGRASPDATLNSVGDISHAITPFLGERIGKLVFSAGILGAGLVASIVVSLASAWGFGEVAGYRRSLEEHPLRAPWFYGVYAACVVAGAAVVALWPNLVALSVDVQVMNALLLPVVLGFLIALAIWALPDAVKLRGWYLRVVVVVAALTTALGVFGAVQGVVAG
jgi:NRAMP (natural resistance-associated macrophage protein)-like metal ion transporter